tara:strand:- start:113 stop:742 length:630 start_codon:yes stop_codon:yes gene_type:complete
MDASHKELTEIKGYVARLYGIVRSKLASPDNQTPTETIEDISATLQIANSFQQDEIFQKLTDVESLLKQLLDAVPNAQQNTENLLKQILDIAPETFTKVDEWFGMGMDGKGMGDILAYVIEESEKSYHIKTPFQVQIWRGPGWVRRGYEPCLISAGDETIVTVNKSKVLTYFKPRPNILEAFMNSEAYHASYNPVIDPFEAKKTENLQN